MIVAEYKMVRSNRISSWFAMIADAEKDGWKLLSIHCEPGWFINTYRAVMGRNPEVQVQFDVGPISNRV